MLALVGLTAQAHAYRITHDPGGRIGAYVDRYQRINYSGERVEIDGACLSACTLVLGIVPRDRICVTKRAVLGFHEAWAPKPVGYAYGSLVTRPMYSEEGTRELWKIYPSSIKHLITMRGGLTHKMFFVRGKELAAMYPLCSATR